MIQNKFKQDLLDIVEKDIPILDGKNFISLSKISMAPNQNSTNSAFSKKWLEYNKSEDKEIFFEMQREWYLKLYGFPSESELANYLQSKKYIYDAGSGMGYKAAWFAKLAPESIVIGMDFSDTAKISAETYADIPNLFFIQGDIADPLFKDGSIDYVSCDQVIMHTEEPVKTFAELTRITKSGGEFSCYFYAKKALPRELIDEYFRQHCTSMTHEELMQMSEQLTELGKRLSELNISLDVPAIPALGIKGGEMDIQRFIYWNFLKCFWSSDLGHETSVITNLDWYSPTNAKRFSYEEVRRLVSDNQLTVVNFHSEEACYSGRFKK